MDDLLQFLNLTSFETSDFAVLGILIVLEGLLSCDNAVVLALLVKDLPKHQQGKALRYGIIGAYVFRIIALLLAVWIMTIWWLKMLGGLYLCWLAIDFFYKKSTEHEHGTVREIKRIFGLSAFWSVVVWVELTDIAFSIDSIAAAVAMSKKMWVLILGGFLGILAMRFAAQGFITLLNRFPRLESCAFAAIAVIGFKLLLEFPLDIAGRNTPFPTETTYATTQEYQEAISTVVEPTLYIPQVITVRLSAPPAPDFALFTAGADDISKRMIPALPADQESQWAQDYATQQYKESYAAWALHYRPFIEIEGWVSSLIVLGIFALGFVRPRRELKP